MNDISITSEPAQPPAKSTARKPKKRKMSAAQRKVLSDAAKERWAAKKTAPASSEVDRIDYYSSHPDGTFTPIGSLPVAPVKVPDPIVPSPAVLALQGQVVELVSLRHQSRTMLNECHNAYLLAQSRFQAAESELKGIEAEVQYRITLIAQLENRQPSNQPYPVANTPVLQMPTSLTGVSSEPAQALMQQRQPAQERFAVGSADDLRREMRSMM